MARNFNRKPAVSWYLFMAVYEYVTSESACYKNSPNLYLIRQKSQNGANKMRICLQRIIQALQQATAFKVTMQKYLTKSIRRFIHTTIDLKRQSDRNELNWTELPVQLRCTDCTKQTNWKFSSIQFTKGTKRVQFILFAVYAPLIITIILIITRLRALWLWLELRVLNHINKVKK